MKSSNRHPQFRSSALRTKRLVRLSAVALAAVPALGSVITHPTTDPQTLADALHPSVLNIISVSIHNGVAGQFGTYDNFELAPVTIRPGIVLSSGDVTDLGPIPGATDPEYDPSSPPQQVNNQMYPEPETGATAEFDAYGLIGGNIENFMGCYDVAALRVDFTLVEDSPVKFDFIFGSVEFPFYTGSFTDSFVVFLDGFAPENQITFDAAGNAVQVGSSFAGLETTADLNTAFSDPHGLIHHLTTTTARLDNDGPHFLVFEIGDVNDHILDSAVFIANLRAEEGAPGTEPSDDDLPLQWAGNGHYYELVKKDGMTPALGVSWGAARDGAAAKSYLGLQGYLATLTSQGENDFVLTSFDDFTSFTGAWIAAIEPANDGTWTWGAGPESGEVFSHFATPVTYANWGGAEPNNQQPTEDYGAIALFPHTGGGIAEGEWFDSQFVPNLLTDPIVGYIVEYSIPTCCPGNADKATPGSVNFADLTAVLANFGRPAFSTGVSEGDADCNGIVNFADVTNVLANFLAPCE